MKAGAVLISLSFLISKILGLLRDNLLAASFGASGGQGKYNLDVYFASFRLPDLIFSLLSFGVLSAAFLPIFVEILKTKEKKDAFRFSNDIFYTLGTIVLGLSLILFIIAPVIVKIIVPGFTSENFAATVGLTRLMLISPFFLTIGSIAGGIQNSFHRFFGLALAPVVYNLGIIAGILLFPQNWGVYSIAAGVAIGAFLNMAVQLPGIYKLGFRLERFRAFWSQRIKEVLILSFPRIIGMSMSQLALVIDTIIASTLTAGSITVINFAVNLSTIPVGLIGISASVVSFGVLAGYGAEKNYGALAGSAAKTLRKILFLIIPLTAGMFALRLEIVKLLLGRGKFGSADVTITANTLALFLAGVIFYSLIFLLARSFYALKNTKTPVKISVTAAVINILLSLLLSKILHFGTYGLAAANAAASTINALALIVALQKTLGAPLLQWKEILKFFSAAVFMTVAIYLLKNSGWPVFSIAADSALNTAVQITICALAALIVYFGLCRCMKCKDMIY